MKSTSTAVASTQHAAGVRVWLAVCGFGLGSAVAAPPTFTQEPGSLSALAGQNVLLTAAAASAQPVGYQWRLNDADLPGQTNPTLDLFCVSAAQSGQVYSVRASNLDGSVTSGPATLEVNVPLGTAQPFCWGYDPSAAHRGFVPSTHRASPGAVHDVTILDTTLGSLWGTDIYTDDSSLSAAAVHTGLLVAGEQGTVRLKITGPQTSYVGSARNGVTSNAYGAWPGSYQLLSAAPTIARHPVSQARMLGGTAQFDVLASGPGPFRYQWFRNGNRLEGATNPSLSFLVSSGADNGTYVCTVTDDARGTATSSYAVLGVLPATPGPPQIPSLVVNALEIGSVARVVLTGSATAGTVYGTGTYHSSSNLRSAAVHAGLLAEGETGVVAVVRMPDQEFFQAELANGVTSLGLNSASGAFAFLASVPHVTQDPATRALLPGTTTTLSVSASFPQPFSVQWRKNGVALVGQTHTTLTVTADSPGTTATYDAVLAAPGAPTLTQPAQIITLDQAGGHVYTVATAQQAVQHLSTAGNLVFVPVQGAAEGGTLWGTDVYTTDSSLGLVAVHAGLLSPGETGTIGLYSLGSWPSFTSATRHGVTSIAYGRYNGMTLLAARDPSQTVRVTTTAPGTLLISNATGRLAQIWASPSLLPGSWIPLDTVNITSSPQSWVDPTPAIPPTRFYRVVAP